MQRLEMLGGTIQFESSLGRGTKVTTKIPAA
jgi:signal transduction histidine kinase